MSFCCVCIWLEFYWHLCLQLAVGGLINYSRRSASGLNLDSNPMSVRHRQTDPVATVIYSSHGSLLLALICPHTWLWQMPPHHCAHLSRLPRKLTLIRVSQFQSLSEPELPSRGTGFVGPPKPHSPSVWTLTSCQCSF